MEDVKVVKIMEFRSLQTAEIYKALLESAGVTCELWHSESAQIVPFSGPLTEIELVVNELDKERAIELLNAKFDSTEIDTEEA